MNDEFRKFAQKASVATGSPVAFGIAFAIVIIWGCLGHLFNYSDTWQLVINTGTTIITFLMVFLIQSTQNREGRAMHLKLDELIRADKHARNQLIDLERLSDEELDKVHDDLCNLQNITEEKIKIIRHKKNKHKK